ncbi:hypothetical protein H6G06_05110 [Anabaena sphaerica FACHB-251]|uniref:Uncharacterized protein n=1 Tax=Anabaena sphaerica FACHB-251 TaxID=2692883 RepID=A0A926WDZ9_9NOST|nr:hypothetical protein [Anabaena sphaerica]MBD2292876.1 hypothetical protein [Anabaena sphaerica FACHB-251]
MRIRLEVNESLVKMYCEIPTQDLEKYRKWLIWCVTVSLPVLVSYSTAIKFLPHGTLPLHPSQEINKPVKLP